MVPSISKLEETILSRLNMAEMGMRGALRMSQTLLKVYPHALRWGLSRRKPSPAELRAMFESLGATYIKFGQLVASSPSIFPKEYVDEFQLLLDQTPTIPFAKIRQIIEGDLGRPLEEVYSFVDSTPLASASIAQVHVATLLSGEDVVVKVQKPGVRAIINVDMNTAYVCARITEMMMPNIGKDAIAGMIAELYQAMIDECDFRKEAQHLEEFRSYLKSTANAQVLAPKPYPLASGEQVLTMERFYGKPLTDLEQIKTVVKDPATTLMAAMNTWFASLTQCESFHADLHNGNMMVLDDGRVAFIDFGMVGRIQPEAWQAVFNLMGGLSEQNYRLVAESMLAVGVTKEDIKVDELCADIEQLFESVYDIAPESVLDSPAGISGIDEAMTNLGEVSKKYGIRFPRAFTLLLKQFLYFDRYIEILAPGLDMFAEAQMEALERGPLH